jgi:hypothetical protein
MPKPCKALTCSGGFFSLGAASAAGPSAAGGFSAFGSAVNLTLPLGLATWFLGFQLFYIPLFSLQKTLSSFPW